MPLTGVDIKRIVKQGYRYKDFVIRRKRDRYLKNQSGKCAFLGDNGCEIYSIRPNGCRLYPLVYNEKTNQAIIHDFCPYGYMFMVTRENVENLSSLIKRLEKQF
jgi:Fe-S-cluster containining protein